VTASSTASFTMDHERAGRYTVRIVPEALNRPELDAVLDGRRSLVVVSPTVERLYAPALDALAARNGPRMRRIVCVSGEPAKGLAAVERICDAALAAGMDRHGVFVAVGGGVCSDLVTMAASLVRRGVRCVRIPTTLVAQIDAAIGAKGAVNFAGRKSSLGCFHPPALVLADPVLLRTLPLPEIRAGLAEIIKIALVSDAPLFELLERVVPELLATRFQEPADDATTVMAASIRRMLEALDGNLFEDRSYRRTVDAGHTFSPKLEAAARFTIRHGEAVAVDLALSATLAARLGFLATGTSERIRRLIATAGLPITSDDLTAELCRDALAEAVRHRGGRLNLPLFDAVGHARFVDTSQVVDQVLELALEDLRLPLAEDQRVGVS